MECAEYQASRATLMAVETEESGRVCNNDDEYDSENKENATRQRERKKVGA